MSIFKRKNAKIASLIFTIIIVVGLILSATVTSRADFSATDYDFSRPGSGSSTVLSGADILSAYLGESLIESEERYLAEHSKVTLKYSDTITTAYVLTSYESGVFTVTARPYSYIAENGVLVSWIPNEALFDGESYTLTQSNGDYVASFMTDTTDESAQISVTYSVDFTISAADISHLLSEAYHAAEYYSTEIPRRIMEREELISQYDSDLIRYDEYLRLMSEYESNNAIYLEYIRQKAIYDDNLAAYEGYLSDLAAYNAAIENNKNLDLLWEEYYLNYALYLDYLERYSEYERDAESYGEYLARVERLSNQLSAIEAASVAMTDGRKVYDAIMGSTVTKVLENKDLIASNLIGVSAEVVDSAGIATDNLRVLLAEYFALETFEERYAYYTVNYIAIRDNFILLLRSLDNLYRNPKVRGYLILEGMDKKYIILVAQLAYISNALSDTPIYSYFKDYTYDENFTIEGRTVPDILEYQEYLVDTGSAAPDPKGYPPRREEPIAPDLVTEPIKPSRVEVTAYPDSVEHPGDAPSVVDEPTMPESVYHPGTRPEPYTVPEEISALLDSYNRGELSLRPSTEDSFTISLDKTVTKRPFDPTSVTVSFYNYNGSLVEAIEIDRGTVADFSAELPKRDEDASATYVFSHWQDSEGNSIDLSSVNESIEAYPAFTAIPKTYTVTFLVGESSMDTVYLYGETPVFTGEPTLSPDSRYIYTFVGWDKDILPVTGDVTYTAIFSGEYILPYAGGGASVTESDNAIIVDAKGSALPTLNISNLIQYSVGRVGKEIRLLTRFGDLAIPYATAVSMYNDGVESITISTTQISSHGYRYMVSTDGATDRQYRLTVSVPFGSLSVGGVLFRLDSKNNRQYIKSDKQDGIITYLLQTGVDYTYTVERSAGAIQHSLVGITLSGTTHHPGDTVYVTTDIHQAADLTRLYYIDADGNEVDILGGRFTMPDSDVTVLATARLREFKITFKDGRHVLATYTYKYGDTVTPPKDPKKHSDAIYSYSFVGWRLIGSDNVTTIPTVSGDATYTAVYKSTLIPKATDDGSIKISESVMRIIVIAIIVITVVVLGVVTLIIILIVRLVRARKLRRKVDKKDE